MIFRPYADDGKIKGSVVCRIRMAKMDPHLMWLALLIRQGHKHAQGHSLQIIEGNQMGLALIRHAIASNSIRLLDNPDALTLDQTEVTPGLSVPAGRRMRAETLVDQNCRPYISHVFV